jgi:GDPmannose 4,6-dehydratase
MPMKALIFGSAGQDGPFLADLLRSRNIDVVGVSRSGGEVRGSVADGALVTRLVQEHRPGYVFHLAANSTTRHDALFDNHDAIATGTLNILEAVRLHAPAAKVFLSGSALQFHNVGTPIDDQAPFAATSPYAIARIQSVYAGRYFRSTFGMAVYTGYFFNHDSPLRTERHVNQKIVRAVQRIQAGSKERLVLGDLDVRKEFNYAGDVVAAVWTLVNQDAVFEAVIGCGEAHSIREWVEYCFGAIGRSWKEHVSIDSDYVAEYPLLVSDPARIRALGWKPAVDFTGLADIMLADQS